MFIGIVGRPCPMVSRTIPKKKKQSIVKWLDIANVLLAVLLNKLCDLSQLLNQNVALLHMMVVR